MLTNRRRAGRSRHPSTFPQGFASGLCGLATFNLDVRMLPRNSVGPALIAGALLIVLWWSVGLGATEAVTFIGGALFSAHLNSGPAPRSSYIYLWLLAGIIAGGWVVLAGWAGLLAGVSPPWTACVTVVIATFFWAVGSAKIRRVALATTPAASDRGQGSDGTRQ